MDEIRRAQFEGAMRIWQEQLRVDFLRGSLLMQAWAAEERGDAVLPQISPEVMIRDTSQNITLISALHFDIWEETRRYWLLQMEPTETMEWLCRDPRAHVSPSKRDPPNNS